MQYKANLDPRKIIGRRPNLAEQNTVADEIVSVLSVPPEDMPLPPLSPLPPTKPSPARKRNPQGVAIAATVLLFVPFLYPFVLLALGVVMKNPLPLYYYLPLVFVQFPLSILGGGLLYLASRYANALRKLIGWVALAMLLVPVIAFSILRKRIFDMSEFTIHSTESLISMCNVLLTLLIMIALCVFDVLLLSRLFRKEQPSPAE